MSLAGLWLMPALISLHLHFWRFLVVWAAYSAVTGHLLSLCIGKRVIAHTTPRRVRSHMTLAAVAAAAAAPV